jgi:hypothetical protein
MFLLTCSVCQKQLVNPITLSCGYTVCFKCLPSQACLEGPTFICPVKQCSKKSHLFGPNLSIDDTIHNIIKKDLLQQEQLTVETYNIAINVLQCSIGDHLLQHPITSHCGHTSCKLCLLQCKLSNSSCGKCQKKLPSYQFLQHQSSNFLLDTILTALKQVPQSNINISAMSKRVNTTMSLMDLNKTIYEKVPIYRSDFPVLPSQKLRIPIYTKQHHSAFLKVILPCKSYQCLCFGILNRSRDNYKGHIGTIVKITAVEQRGMDLIIDVTGLDRFQVLSMAQECETPMIVDLEMKFETVKDLGFIMEKDTHWTDYCEPQQPEIVKKQPSHEPKLSDLLDIDDNIAPTYATLSVAPPIETICNFSSKSPSIKLLSYRIHGFISELAHSTPSTSFCSTIEGLLGPVWLDSVQGLYGTLPSADNAVAMCWWVAIVLPVSNAERIYLLEQESLEERLNIILSWISGLKSQWSNCRRKTISSAAKAQAFR